MTLLTGASVKVYVEDSADTIWSVWFPPDRGVQFENAGSKSQARNKVQDDVKKGFLSFGVVDRDFDDDAIVEQSLAQDSHVCILRRYAVENYLLEPQAVADTVARLPAVSRSEPEWKDPAYVEQTVLAWAYQLRFYAAANYLIDGWNRHILLLRFFRPGQPDHLFDRDLFSSSKIDNHPKGTNIANASHARLLSFCLSTQPQPIARTMEATR